VATGGGGAGRGATDRADLVAEPTGALRIRVLELAEPNLERLVSRPAITAYRRRRDPQRERALVWARSAIPSPSVEILAEVREDHVRRSRDWAYRSG
jgi:hypothetical protein